MSNEMKKKGGKFNKAVKILGIIILIFFLFILAAFLVIHFYLGKIDYQKDEDITILAEDILTEEFSQEDSGQEDYDQEDYGQEDSGQEDSSAEEIAALEEQLRRQTADMEEVMFDEEVFNILLIGCDSRQKDGRGRSDTNILMSVNCRSKEITMTSIMRDSYVAIPGHGNNRINASYAYGGGKLLSETIEKNLRIRVDGYAAVDFYAFMDIIDVFGGVDIEVSDAEVKVMNRYIKELNRLKGFDETTDQLRNGGKLHLNGKQALAYARVRYVGNADFERTQRQRTVLEKVFEKAKKMNLLELHELLDILLPEVKTNLSEKEVFFLLLQAPEYLKYELKAFRIPADNTYESLRIGRMEVLGVDLEKNRKLLEEEVYGSDHD